MIFRSSKDKSAIKTIEQNLLLETFAKLCSQLNEKNHTERSPQVNKMVSGFADIPHKKDVSKDPSVS